MFNYVCTSKKGDQNSGCFVFTIKDIRTLYGDIEKNL